MKTRSNNEDDTVEIIGAVKRQKPLEDNIGLLSTMVAVN